MAKISNVKYRFHTHCNKVLPPMVEEYIAEYGSGMVKRPWKKEISDIEQKRVSTDRNLFFINKP